MSLSSSDNRFLLDTNIISHMVREPQGVIAHRIAQVGENRVCTSIIVAAELRYGAAKRASALLYKQVEMILEALEILPFKAPADAVYARLRVELESTGRLIGPNDLLIAAQAQTLRYTLVTDNQGEFARVPGLKIQNWLVRAPRPH